MVTHLAFAIRNGEKQKTPALNNKERGKVKSTQKKQKHTYLIDGRTYISNRLSANPVPQNRKRIQYVPSKKGNIWRINCTDTLISYTIIYGFSESLWCEEFREHIRLSKKITREIKVHEDINMECSNPDHWIQQKILPILDYKNSSIRQLFQVLQLF